MPEYFSVESDVTFFHHRKSGEYVVIHKGLPFTVPEGDVSMVILNPDKSQEFVNNLVTGTLYEIESRPDDPEAQAIYDQTLNERSETIKRQEALRSHGSVGFS